MKVRVADFEKDGAKIIEGAWRFIEQIENKDWLPEDRDSFETNFIELCRNPALEVFVADHDGEPVAGIGLLSCPYWLNPQMLAVEDMFWFAFKEAPPMAAAMVLRRAIDWAKEKAKPNKVIFTLSRIVGTSPSAVEQIYEKLELNHTEIRHTGVL